MAKVTNAINDTVGASNSGATNTFTVTNPSDTASSAAQAIVTVGGTSAADPWIQWSIGYTQTYSLGIDNSDSDTIKLTTDASGSVDPSSGTSLITCTTGGHINVITDMTVGSTAAIGTNDTLTIGNAAAGGNGYQVSIRNGDLVDGKATFSATTHGTSTGDPTMQWNITTGSTYTAGIDNSASDVWQLTTQNGLGANIAQQVTSAGEVTFPSTPAFLAQADGTQINIPINSSTTLQFPTEIYDQNSDYNAGTYTFVAPVSGRYPLNVILQLDQVDSATTSINFNLVTSNRTYVYHYTPNIELSGDGAISIDISTVADMDASDSAYVSVQINNTGASQMDLVAVSYFSGYLAC